jgi:hypothetical protein
VWWSFVRASYWVIQPANETTIVQGQTGWTKTDLSMQSINIIYPLGSGPRSDLFSKNAFFLPNGFLREAPQDPKAGTFSPLGSPGGALPNDWLWEGKFIVSSQVGPILLRFAADVSDPAEFDPLFSEGLSCAVALNVCERLTQSNAKLAAIGSEYKQFMGDARTVNGIEKGEVEAPMDDWLSVRY